MPIFATSADMQDGRFPTRDLIELTDDAGAGVIDIANLNRALVQADNEINGYLLCQDRAAHRLPAAVDQRWCARHQRIPPPSTALAVHNRAVSNWVRATASALASDAGSFSIVASKSPIACMALVVF